MRDSWARHLETCSYDANVIGLFTVLLLLLYVCNMVACKLASSVAEDAVEDTIEDKQRTLLVALILVSE